MSRFFLVLALLPLVASLASVPTALAHDNQHEEELVFSAVGVRYDVDGTGMTGKELSAKLRERGVLSNAVGQYRMRMLTHFDVTREQCERAMEVMSEVCAGVPVAAVGD